MENKEKVRKPCPRPKKKTKTKKQKSKKKSAHLSMYVHCRPNCIAKRPIGTCFTMFFTWTWNLCVWLAGREREREENDRILECAVLLLDESCWSNVAHTVCRWKKNQLQPQLGNDPLWSADRNRVWQTEEDPWRVAWFRPTKEVKWSDVKGWVCTCNMIYQAM